MRISRLRYLGLPLLLILAMIPITSRDRFGDEYLSVVPLKADDVFLLEENITYNLYEENDLVIADFSNEMLLMNNTNETELITLSLPHFASRISPQIVQVQLDDSDVNDVVIIYNEKDAINQGYYLEGTFEKVPYSNMLSTYNLTYGTHTFDLEVPPGEHSVKITCKAYPNYVKRKSSIVDYSRFFHTYHIGLIPNWNEEAKTTINVYYEAGINTRGLKEFSHDRANNMYSMTLEDASPTMITFGAKASFTWFLPTLFVIIVLGVAIVLVLPFLTKDFYNKIIFTDYRAKLLIGLRFIGRAIGFYIFSILIQELVLHNNYAIWDNMIYTVVFLVIRYAVILSNKEKLNKILFLFDAVLCVLAFYSFKIIIGFFLQ